MAVERVSRSVTVESVNPTEAPTRRLFTVDEYYAMAEAGILRPDERVQLIEGVIISMPSIGPRHAYNVSRVGKLILARLGDEVEVRFQNPIRLASGAEPEPDVAVVLVPAGGPQVYGERHPVAAETLLVIEVADSTLAFDLGEKALMYARAGIADYWVFDLAGHRIVVHRGPTAEGYASVDSVESGASIVPSAFPDIVFTADEILG